MAVLSDAERRSAWAQWMSENRDGVAVDKATIRACVDAVDDLFENSMSAFNNAINNAGGASLTGPQRRRIARLVIERRFGSWRR